MFRAASLGPWYLPLLPAVANPGLSHEPPGGCLALCSLECEFEDRAEPFAPCSIWYLMGEGAWCLVMFCPSRVWPWATATLILGPL